VWAWRKDKAQSETKHDTAAPHAPHVPSSELTAVMSTFDKRPGAAGMLPNNTFISCGARGDDVTPEPNKLLRQSGESG
jgi:hypothetical protein